MTVNTVPMSNDVAVINMHEGWKKQVHVSLVTSHSNSKFHEFTLITHYTTVTIVDPHLHYKDFEKFFCSVTTTGKMFITALIQTLIVPNLHKYTSSISRQAIIFQPTVYT